MHVPTVTMNNGIEIPQLGLGVWQIENGHDVEEAVRIALDTGYRMVDTAAVYCNEAGVGNALRASGLSRRDLFVTTKVWNSSQGFDSTLRAFEESMDELDLGYIDLYLIHWPMPRRKKFTETWRALETLYEEGRVRAIGVANFTPEHLEELIAHAKVVPTLNQVELHPYFSQKDLRRYCASKNIIVESWSPLMRGGDILNDKVVHHIARIHDKTPAQVVLRWHLQHGLVVIPKSALPEHAKENINIFDFELTEKEMSAIDDLDRSERVGPDPDKFNS